MNIILDTLASNVNNFIIWAKSTIPEKFKAEMTSFKIGDLEAYSVESIQKLVDKLTLNEKEDFNVVNKILKDKENGITHCTDVESMSVPSVSDMLMVGSIKLLLENEIDYIGKKDKENVLLSTKKMFVTDLRRLKLPPIENSSHIEKVDNVVVSEALRTHHTNKTQVLKNVDKLKVMITDGEVDINTLDTKNFKLK